MRLGETGCPELVARGHMIVCMARNAGKSDGRSDVTTPQSMEYRPCNDGRCRDNSLPPRNRDTCCDGNGMHSIPRLRLDGHVSAPGPGGARTPVLLPGNRQVCTSRHACGSSWLWSDTLALSVSPRGSASYLVSSFGGRI
jgi:hypothetical protein